MKGQQIKELLKAEGYSLSEIASALGYSNDQRLHSALKSDDVKSGLIENIARVINKNVGFFYGTSGQPASLDAIDDNCVARGETELSLRFIGLLESRDNQIDKLIAQQDRYLAIIEKSR